MTLTINLFNTSVTLANNQFMGIGQGQGGTGASWTNYGSQDNAPKSVYVTGTGNVYFEDEMFTPGGPNGSVVIGTMTSGSVDDLMTGLSAGNSVGASAMWSHTAGSTARASYVELEAVSGGATYAPAGTTLGTMALGYATATELQTGLSGVHPLGDFVTPLYAVYTRPYTGLPASTNANVPAGLYSSTLSPMPPDWWTGKPDTTPPPAPYVGPDYPGGGGYYA